MKIVAVIPARYKSSRFPGKPLADILGKPMIWWVYQEAKKVEDFSEVYVATDDERILNVCRTLGMQVIMTDENHSNHISRVHEVANFIEADYYVCVNGDEPLLSGKCISPVIPKMIHKKPWFSGAMRRLTDPAEAIDPDNIKLIISDSGKCLYMSRIPVPFPRNSLFIEYWKYVGIECFNKAALNFFVSTPQGKLEKIEDIDHLRFLENGVDLHFKAVESDSLSVDTPKDLEKVIQIMKAIPKHGGGDNHSHLIDCRENFVAELESEAA